jgi:hypothetical protein
MTSLEGVPQRACDRSELGVVLSVRAAEIPLVTPVNGMLMARRSSLQLDSAVTCVALGVRYGLYAQPVLIAARQGVRRCLIAVAAA